MPDQRRRVKRRQRWALALGGLIAVSGCGSGGDTDVVPIGADGYTAVIDDFLPPVPSDGSRPVVYVARLGDDPFTLDDQIEMIAAVEEHHDLRFVDDIAAAIDAEESDAPPRDDGLLFGIGTISTAVPHVVRVEVYTTADIVDAYKVTLAMRQGVWRVETSEPIDPEVLVGDE